MNVYDSVPPHLREECGYFEPKSTVNLVSGYRLPFWPYGKKFKGSQILYYPGAFGVFHEGHMSVVVRALQDHMHLDPIVVIAPSNSDYLVDKYGAWSPLASNKKRFDRIIAALEKLPENLKFRVCVDTTPMLNYTCDQNFTDLALDFCGMFEYKAPVIICGKDRVNFEGLNLWTNKVSVKHYDMTIEASTSSQKQSYPDIEKKDLILRVWNDTQVKIFSKYMGEFYKSITPVFISDEIEEMKNIMKPGDVTICKDYKDHLPYFSISRRYMNPLSDPVMWESRVREIVRAVGRGSIIDSDSFSGTTVGVFEKYGGDMKIVRDLRGQNMELLDIDDFRQMRYTYPWVDVSSRCSLPAFTHKDHKMLMSLSDELCKDES